MRLTQEIDYAFRIVSYLASRDGEIIGAPTISDAMVVPERFTLRILRKLNLADITEAKRGAQGGYFLKKPKEEITLYDIIVAIDGPIVINRCLHSDDPYCNRNDPEGMMGCIFHQRLAGVQDDIIQQFKGAKITDFI